MIGQEIGNFVVETKIGEGGMGAVYLATHRLIGKTAVIKVLLPSLSKNRELTSRFFQEAKSAASIDHPGIVEIYDFGHNPDGTAFIIMEHLRGESLTARMHRVGVMVPVASAEIMQQIAGALQAAHERSIVHRDLKPDNIFLVPDPQAILGERVKLLDFGIAKLTSGKEELGHKTQTGSLMGTPLYMAPEQCQGRADIDARADLYSLGCIMFEQVCGRPPFCEGGAGAILAAHLVEEVPDLRSIRPDLDPQFCQIVRKLLAKSPADRFQTASELQVALNSYRMTQNAGAMAMHLDPPGPAVGPIAVDESLPQTDVNPDIPTVPMGSRRRWWLAAAGVVGFAAVVFAALAVLGPGRAKEHADKAATANADASVASQMVPSSKPQVNDRRAAALGAKKRTITVRSVPSGAVVFEGAKRLGKTPLRIHVTGARRLILKKAGFNNSPLKVGPSRRSYKARMVKVSPPAVERPAVKPPELKPIVPPAVVAVPKDPKPVVKPPKDPPVVKPPKDPTPVVVPPVAAGPRKRFGRLSGPCRANGRCNPGLECKKNVCRKRQARRGSIGGQCYPNHTCDVGGSCNRGRNRCVRMGARGSVGGACYPNGTCNAGLKCRLRRCRRF